MIRLKRTILACVIAALFCLSFVQTATAQSTPESGKCNAGFRLFRDEKFLAYNPVCIPEAPKRIALVDFAALDVAYTLELPVVAYWNLLTNGWYANMVPELAPSIKGYLKDAKDVGAIPVNLESLLAAAPDLILINSLLVSDAATYEKFSAIAPTVAKKETNVDDWRDYMRFYGRALNVEAKVEALITDYNARQKQFRTDAGDLLEGKTVSLIQMNDPATIYLNFPTYRGWLPLGEVGFVASPKQTALADKDNTPNIQLSNEQIGLLDTDYLILMNAAFDPENSQKNQDLFKSYANDALWKTLPAVRNGKLYLVDLAWQANGLISAHAVTDDMYRLFLNTEPKTPNPYAARITAATPAATAPATATR
jgi:iron complex transport system substrate-binding protein